MNSRVFLYDPESGSCIIKEPDNPPQWGPMRNPLSSSGLQNGPGLAGPMAALVGVVGIALLAGPAGRTWIYLLTTAALVALGATLAAIVRRHKALTDESPAPLTGRLREAIRSMNARKTIRDVVLARMLDVLVPLGTIGLIYSAAQLWLDSGVFREGSTRTLLWLEQTAIWLRSEYPLTNFVLKVPKGYEFCSVLMFCLLASFVPLLSKLDVVGRWKKTARWLGRAYIVLTILSSITFFGNQQSQSIAATVARLNGQADRVRQDYGEALVEAERIVSRMAVEQQASNRFAVAVADLREFDRSVSRAEEKAKPASAHGVPVELSSSRLRESVYRAEAFRPQAGEVTSRHPFVEADASPSPKNARDVYENPRWTAKQGESLLATVAKPATAEKSTADKLHPVVDSAADYVHGAIFKGITEPIFAAAGIHDDFLQLLLEPFLKAPGKEMLKRQARELFDRVANRGQQWVQAIAAVRENIRFELAGFPVPPTQESAEENLASRIHGVRMQAADLERAAPAEVRRQVAEEYLRELAAFDSAAGALLGARPDPAIRAAADRLLAAIHTHLGAVPDALERISGLRAIAAYMPAAGPDLPALASFEKSVLRSSIIATAVSQRVPAVLSADARSEWGGIREDMYRRVLQDDNHMDEYGRAAAKRTVSAWLKARNGVATQIAWEVPGRSPEAVAGLWERKFFDYTESNPDMAGLWGFMLIAVRDISPGLTDHTIPEDGFVWYGERTGLADKLRVREIFSTSAAEGLIGAVCASKTPNVSEDLPDLSEHRGSTPRVDGLPRRLRTDEDLIWDRGFPRTPTREWDQLSRSPARDPIRRPIEIRPVVP